MPSKTLHMTIGTEGWINNPVRVADALLTHFFLSEHDQSSFFKENVASFPYILAKNQGSISKACQETQDVLSKYFSTQFSAVEAEVLSEEVEDSATKVALTIYLTFTDTNGENFNMSKIAKFNGMKITEICDILATG